MLTSWSSEKFVVWLLNVDGGSLSLSLTRSCHTFDPLFQDPFHTSKIGLAISMYGINFFRTSAYFIWFRVLLETVLTSCIIEYYTMHQIPTSTHSSESNGMRHFLLTFSLVESLLLRVVSNKKISTESPTKTDQCSNVLVVHIFAPLAYPTNVRSPGSKKQGHSSIVTCYAVIEFWKKETKNSGSKQEGYCAPPTHIHTD